MIDILPWVIFNIFVLIMLSIDLGVFHRKTHVIELKEAILWSLFWIVLSLTFCVGIYYFWPNQMGGYDTSSQAAMSFLTGYVVEKSLSVDNLFVFAMLFAYFGVPPLYQHKVLFWGILGALVMRAIFIFTGVALIEHFSWTIYLLGVLLVGTGIKMAFAKEKEIQPERNPVFRLIRRFVPMSEGYTGKFFTKIDGRLLATPLLLVLAMVETTDIVFAIDSIPAILGITTNTFIIYTSNVFAILGLRALYFALAGFMRHLCYLNYGLAAVLVFIGSKMLMHKAFAYEIPITTSLIIVGVIIGMSAVISLLFGGRRSNNSVKIDPED